jgi:glutathione synthase/RimK-type ligase-like ATP-grasp enzyme
MFTKNLLPFQDFLNESTKSQLKKVMITRAEKLEDSHITGSEFKAKDYWKIITRKTKNISHEFPVLNYDVTALEQLIKSGEIDLKQVYNKPDARENVSSKSAFTEKHKDSNYMVPSVSNPKEISKLNFPIVAKPDNRHSGLGIQVFKDKKELDEADLSKFSLFSEKIDIKSEHRFFVWRGEILQWCKREPLDESTKDISKKKANEETNFAYILTHGKPAENIIKLCSYFSDAHKGLDFYAVDVAESKDGKLYVFEMNTEPGPIFGVMALVYRKIYEDWFKEKLTDETIDLLNEYRNNDIKETLKDNPEWSVTK